MSSAQFVQYPVHRYERCVLLLHHSLYVCKSNSAAVERSYLTHTLCFFDNLDAAVMEDPGRVPIRYDSRFHSVKNGAVADSAQP